MGGNVLWQHVNDSINGIENLWRFTNCSAFPERIRVANKGHYTITSNPGAYEWHYYYLLALQRALTIPPSQEKSGQHNWYEEGAAYLLSQQHPDGSWKSGGQEEPIMSTCFSILFLSKAIPF